MKVAVALAWHLKLQGFSLKGRCDTVDLWKPITLWLLLLSSTSLSPNGRFRVLQTTKNHWWWTIKGDYQHIFRVVILLDYFTAKKKTNRDKTALSHCSAYLTIQIWCCQQISRILFKVCCCSTALVDIRVMSTLTEPDIILSPLSRQHVWRKLFKCVVVVVAESTADTALPTDFLSIWYNFWCN